MNVDEVLQRAMKACSTGTLGQAELLFNQVLAADKQRFDALHMLGILLSRGRNYAEAVRPQGFAARPRSATLAPCSTSTGSGAIWRRPI